MKAHVDLYRATKALASAFADFLTCFEAMVHDMETHVPPHSHPPVPHTAEPDRADAELSALPGDWTMDVSSLETAPVERASPPAAFSAPAAPTPAVAMPPQSKRWTEERLDILRRDYTAGVPVSTILERLNALPAELQVERNHVAATAAYKGWRRPAPGEPADGASPPANISVDKWTPQRRTTAQQLYESGAPMPDIVAAVNALPGAQVTAQSLHLLAAARDLKRGIMQAPQITGHVYATFDQISQWGAERGIVTGRQLPLEEINGRRRHLGLPPFIQEPARIFSKSGGASAR